MDMETITKQVQERLIRYARINTGSQPFHGIWPTTSCQLDLARMLCRELQKIGVANVSLDEKACVVYARIPPSSPEKPGRPFGLIAHMDTAPDACGEGVQPWVLKNYDGGDILLNPSLNIVMHARDYPGLQQYIGQDLVLTDGTTLLGGDDKASIAAIMTLAETCLAHPEFPHSEICLAFTPDEEVGGLARDLDLNCFGADIAYTLDGDHLGYYEDETFYASEALFSVRGLSVHTGTAKGIMINATDIATEFMHSLPPMEKPQYTEGIDGFYHIISCQSDCEHAVIRLIIRDFNLHRFEKREEYLQIAARSLGKKYGADRISLEIRPQYRNMKEILSKKPWLTENLRRAIAESGITPVCEPFRGGTDGAALSFRGLPCPNLSAGYENAHGRFEYVPVQSMAKNVEILLHLCAIYAKESI